MRYFMLILAAAGMLALSACTAVLTPDFGVRMGNLTACPQRLDCISTQDHDPARYIAPLTYSGSRVQARADLLTAIGSVGEVRIVSSHRTYLRVEYPAVNGTDHVSEYYYQPENAVDQVEFYLVTERHTIEMRSIARLGLLDIGANRARLEKLRAVFEHLQQSH